MKAEFEPIIPELLKEKMKLHSVISGSGQPLIIMHGVFGSGDNWASLGRRWSEHFEVHLLDMRNHGKSPHSDEFSYEVMAEDIYQYLNDHNLSSAILLGHSMGGKAAMYFSTINSEMVDHLIVADIAPKPYRPHHGEIINALQRLDLENIESRSEAEERFSKYLDDEGVRMFLLKSLYWKEKGKLAWRFNVPVLARETAKAGEDLPPNAIFHGPTLFLRGSNSNYIKDDDEDLILQHFPQARLETIADAGHWLHAEKPKEVYDQVLKFLKN